MAELDQQQAEQVYIKTNLSCIFLCLVYTISNVSDAEELSFWQDLEKKIEETRLRFKNEFLQG